ncbi:MAG TPA: hypothetical protein VGP72_20900 [Planctomycetota bacterium]|jgi:hypothetical protein
MAGRIVGVAFGILWTIMAIAITSSAPNEGPFPVAKIVFPLFGVVFILAALFGKNPRRSRDEFQEDSADPERATERTTAPPPSAPEPRRNLTDCPHCGAGLKTGSAISPHGDVLCQHCGKWYNVH